MKESNGRGSPQPTRVRSGMTSRWFVTIALALSAFVAIAGCGSDPTPTPTPTATLTATPTPEPTSLLGGPVPHRCHCWAAR